MTAQYPRHTTMADHWWWRPGWQVGTRFYAWHLTQEDQPALVSLAGTLRGAVRAFSTLDPIPDPWLHMTLHGVGHVQDVEPADRDQVVDKVTRRLRRLAPISAAFGPSYVGREGVMLLPEDPAPFAALVQELRAGTAEALGVPEDEAPPFRPHVSIAYSNAPADAAPIRAACEAAEPDEPAPATYRSVSLIRMHRDRRMYEWETVAEVPLGAV
ncbi:2'-5' RNA ligase family protein [Brachybacterium phenoliresistens]|uniref:2'-5' RNA ligase n=1 Tax=Brachybacterium phenoliresistens TaxID=396014 RepID=Z9JTC1_9MICO|nr:2'-5' RNA ligase family protein [Brachybacterium phenoliresistens]EWS81021.1 hypothetical protein BF93_17690 [Brachybacterium phenoliresistens]